MATVAFRPAYLKRRITECERGTVRIAQDRPSVIERCRASMNGQPLEDTIYTRLLISDENYREQVWMTDAEYEWRSNREFVREARGDILIAGLGLGFIVHPIVKSSDVKSVTILERNADVIALVSPSIKSKKVSIVQTDARTWTPPKRSYDVIYFDIWPHVPNEDDKADIVALKKRYRSAMRKGCWMRAWCEDYAYGRMA